MNEKEYLLNGEDAEIYKGIDEVKEGLKEVANSNPKEMHPLDAKNKMEKVESTLIDLAKANYKNVAGIANRMATLSLNKLYKIREFYQTAIEYAYKVEKGEDATADLNALNEYKVLDSEVYLGELKFNVDTLVANIASGKMTTESIKQELLNNDEQIKKYEGRKIKFEPILEFIKQPETLEKLNRVVLSGNSDLLRYTVAKHKKYLIKRGATEFVDKAQVFDFLLFKITANVSKWFEDDSHATIVKSWLDKTGIKTDDSEIDPALMIEIVYTLKSNIALILSLGIVEYVIDTLPKLKDVYRKQELIGCMYSNDYVDVLYSVVDGFLRLV